MLPVVLVLVDFEPGFWPKCWGGGFSLMCGWGPLAAYFQRPVGLSLTLIGFDPIKNS